ncbi:hypothetical protein D3C87_1564700 [compost metagenome]
MLVIEKGAVAVDIRIFAFMKHRVDSLLIQEGMQFRPFGLLDTVIRPEGLRQPVQFTLSKRLDVMLAGKTAVIRWMPVLACDHRFAARFTPGDERIGDIHGAIATGDGQSTTGAEIILQIDQQQGSLLHRNSLFVRRQLTAQVLHHRGTHGLHVQILAE